MVREGGPLGFGILPGGSAQGPSERALEAGKRAFRDLKASKGEIDKILEGIVTWGAQYEHEGVSIFDDVARDVVAAQTRLEDAISVLDHWLTRGAGGA